MTITAKLLEMWPSQLLFSPLAWSKINWFFTSAGKLEMSGFGISAEKNPLYIVDFCTIRQLSDGTNTTLDDMALNEYLAEKAKNGIPPNRCSRVWIHSHPFSTALPSPSGQDNTTFYEKICHKGSVDWAAMVIVGKEETYAELYCGAGPFGGRCRFTAEVIVDWMSALWDTHGEAWEKEYTANIIEDIPAPAPADVGGALELADSATDAYLPYSQQVPWLKKKEAEWLAEYTAVCELTPLGRRDWLWGRFEGFTPKELVTWGLLTIYNSPEALRKAYKKLSKKEKREMERAGRKEGK